MNRKNAFSYIMWFVYSMAVCVSFFAIASTLSVQSGYTEVLGYGISVAWLVFGGLMVFLVHRLMNRFLGGREVKRIPALVAENVVAVILLATGIFLRVRGLAGASEDAAYYELAKVAEGQSIPAVVHGASYIYLQLLHLVYMIFGNKFMAGIWLQIVLQIIAAFCLYRSVRRKEGVIASLVTLGFIMVGPSMVEESLALSPQMLLLVIFAIVLYPCVRCICGSKNKIRAFMIGLLIAIVCYLDISGVVLLFFAITGLLQEFGDQDISLRERSLSTVLCIAGSGVGFVLLMLVDSLASGKAFGSVIDAWWKLYVSKAFLIPDYLQISSIGVEILLLLMLMSLGIFGFWCNFYKECQSIWVLAAGLLLALQCMGMTTTEVNGYLLLYILFAVLAGIGISNIITLTDDEDELKPLDKIVRNSGDDVHVSGRTRVTTAELEEVMVEEIKNEEKKVEEPVAEETAAEEPKVRYLDNPLPVPKKHVKKTLDYDYDVIAGQDDYDLAVSDNDDYDI